MKKLIIASTVLAFITTAHAGRMQALGLNP